MLKQNRPGIMNITWHEFMESLQTETLKRGCKWDSGIGQHGRWLNVKRETLQQQCDSTHSTGKRRQASKKKTDHILQEFKIRNTKGHNSIYINTKKLGKLSQEQER
jgi:sarcosine oxidase delta subunit